MAKEVHLWDQSNTMVATYRRDPPCVFVTESRLLDNLGMAPELEPISDSQNNRVDPALHQDVANEPLEQLHLVFQGCRQ
jgi:hypothetical protein